MEIKITALHFTANESQIQFITKKVERLSKFVNDEEAVAEVTLQLEPTTKKVQLKLDGQVNSCSAFTFEDAITVCVDAMKELLTREKDRRLADRR